MQLLELVWGDRIRERDEVKLYVSYLRRKLGAAAAVDPVETVRGVGYRYRPRRLDGLPTSDWTGIPPRAIPHSYPSHAAIQSSLPTRIWMPTKKKITLCLLSVLALCAALSVPALAATKKAHKAPASTTAGVIHACMKTKGKKAQRGTIRVVTSPKACKKGERALTWNLAGPGGSQGSQGSTGAAAPTARAGQTEWPAPPGRPARAEKPGPPGRRARPRRSKKN